MLEHTKQHSMFGVNSIHMEGELADERLSVSCTSGSTCVQPDGTRADAQQTVKALG
jgi:hypothetical protein